MRNGLSLTRTSLGEANKKRCASFGASVCTANASLISIKEARLRITGYLQLRQARVEK